MNLIARLICLRSWALLLTLVLFLPFDVLVGFCLLLADIFYLLLRPFLGQRPLPNEPPLNVEQASIIVLNWEGRHLLKEFLPSVIAAVKKDGRDHEILV